MTIGSFFDQIFSMIRAQMASPRGFVVTVLTIALLADFLTLGRFGLIDYAMKSLATIKANDWQFLVIVVLIVLLAGKK